MKNTPPFRIQATKDLMLVLGILNFRQNYAAFLTNAPGAYRRVSRSGEAILKNAIWPNLFRNWQQTESKTVLTLKQVPIFQDLTDKEFLELEAIIHERSYHPREIIFKRQAPGEAMYIILSGEVEIYLEDKDGNKNTLATLEQGDFFGELALLDNETRSATAEAVEGATLLVFAQTDLMTLLERKPALGNKILMNLARVTGVRLRKTNELLAAAQKASS